MKLRLAIPAVLAVLLVLLVAGCGGSSDEGGTDPATIAPPKTPLYLDVTVQPQGETKKNIETLAKNLAGITDLGGLIVSQLEASASGGSEVDFKKEIEPWLGEKAALFFEEYEEGEHFNGYGAAVQVEDEGAARSFVEKKAEGEEEPAKKGSYEGVDFYVTAGSGQTIGVFDGLLVFAEDEEIFKSLVDASEGESLGSEDRYTSATANLPSGSAADIYVDIGTLIEEAGGEIDSETELFLDSVGIEPKEATALASLIPGSDRIEVDFSTNLSGDNPPSGDASGLLGSLPAHSVAAFASSEFGDRFNEAIDRIDAQGIPSQGIPPHKLKSTLKKAGIDLESIASSIGDVGAFVEGSSERNLTGSFVLQAEDAQQAKNTVSNIGLFLRAGHTPGVTAIGGGAAGFSVHSPELGRQPLVVISKGERIAIGYGLAAAKAALAESAETLSDLPAYKEAVSALGGTPITAFVDVPAAVELFSKIKPPGTVGLEQVELGFKQKSTYAAIGTEASGGLATAKLIIGVKK